MIGKIGTLEWDDCESCIHSDIDEGGCNIEGDIPVSINYIEEAIICLEFETRNGREQSTHNEP